MVGNELAVTIYIYIYIYHYKLVPLNVQDMVMALPYGTNPESPRSVRDKTSMFHLKPCVAFRDKAKQKNIVEQQYKMQETIHWLF